MDRDIQKIIGALKSPVRREILALVWERELPAGEIAAAFEVTGPTISQHLAVLREAGLVTATAVGTSRRYRARREVLSGLHGALETPGKWSPADDVPERALSTARTGLVVVAVAEVETDQATTFAAFTDPSLHSRWLGVPVTIDNGRFACRLEWGTQVRGRYEVVHPPELIVMRWDFEDDTVPVPGGERIGYLRITQAGAGSRVEVDQLVDTPEQARFMEQAWSFVLGRLRAGVVAACDPGATVAPRPPRTKRRRTPDRGPRRG
jgi:DNA-binding transcriptional ArsR family regulator